MTAKRDLKRRVRERQGRTGESYMTALRHVLDQRPNAVPVVEMIELSEVADAMGIQCRFRMSPALADRIDAVGALRRLRDALIATERDPAFDLFRRVVLHGESPVLRPTIGGIDAGRRFIARVRAGIGGISEHGRLLALMVDGRRGPEMVVFMLWLSPVAHPRYQPSLILAVADGTIDGPGTLSITWR
ncbi:MAG TPA: hypothetical protein VF516_24365 [Kofleriaceae bacterium]